MLKKSRHEQGVEKAFNIYTSAATISLIALVLFLMSAAVFFGQEGFLDNEDILFSNPLKPRYVYLVTYLVSGILLFAVATRKFSFYRPSFTSAKARRVPGFVLIMSLFGVLHLAWLPVVQGNPVVDRLFVLRMNVVALTICGQILLLSISRIRPVLTAVQLVVIGTCVLNVAEVFTPWVFPYRMVIYYGRAAGLYWDPNECATFIAMSLPLMNVGQSARKRLTFKIITFIGVALTFSRGGVILWTIAAVMDSALQPGRSHVSTISNVRNLTILSASVAIVLLIGSYLSSNIIDALRPFLNADSFSRISGSDEGSSAERLYVLQLGFELFKTHPLLGGGIGAVHTWDYRVSVHNMYILLMNEFGIVGLVWYAFFIWIIFQIPLRMGFVTGIQMIVISLFTHTWFDLYYTMIIIQLIWRAGWLQSMKGVREGASIGLRRVDRYLSFRSYLITERHR